MNEAKVRPRRSPAGLTLLLFGLLSCAGADVEEDVPYLIRHGEYTRAVKLAETALRKNPDDPGAKEHHLRSLVAWKLDRARQALFAGQPEMALGLFYDALELDPTHPHCAMWIFKTRNQLAESWLDEAQGLFARGLNEEALEAFEKALGYVVVEDASGRSDFAGNIRDQARLGIARVLLTLNYRAGQSRSYYVDGLSDFRELLLNQARTSFEKSETYGSTERAADRRERVEKLLAEERLAHARELEAVGFYFAARNEYRLVLLIDPESVAAREGLDRMDREVRASRSMSQVEMRIRRGELDRAREPLEEAKRLTTAQVEGVQRLEAEIEDARLRAMYDAAVSLEHDFLYAQSVMQYDRLLEEVEFYEDAIARRQTVQWLMASAEELYAKAESAEVEADAFNYYWEIQNLVWPEYGDVEEKLASLRAKGHGFPDEVLDTSAPERKEWKPIRRPLQRPPSAYPSEGSPPEREPDDHR